MLVCPKCGSTYTRVQEFCGLDGAKLVKSDEDPLIGQTIDKYRIEAPLGSGGMATVYRARHQFLDKDYAIKVLHGQIAADAAMSRRFQREAKTLGSIRHLNVVSVDNFGTTPAGLLYMVMEFLDGLTLSQTLRSEGPLPVNRAADVVRQIATGLQAAHRKGFIHRDLKPGNVMIVPTEAEGDRVKLMDFGLVRIASQEDTQTQLTQEGQFFGTPMYMAPEQIMGGDVGPRADLYALGVMLYQMLSGRPPFTGDLKALAFAHVQTPPPPMAESYAGLADLATALMAKNPADRPADAAAVVSRIDLLALTPISRPIAAPIPTTASVEPMNPVDASVDPEMEMTLEHDASGDPALSRPILQEERAFRTQHEDEAEMLRASIQAALGNRKRTRARLLWAMLVLISIGAGGLFAANEGYIDVEGLRQKFFPSAKPSPEPSAPTAKADDEPFGGPAAAPPPTPPPIALPPAAPDAGVVVAPPPPRPLRAFVDLDAALNRQLSERGLSFDDVLEVAPRNGEQWKRWRLGEQKPSLRSSNQLYNALATRVADLDVTSRRFINSKVQRIKTDLSVLKLQQSKAYPALTKRLDTLLKRSKRRRTVKLVAELTRLEADVGAAFEGPPEPSPQPAEPSASETKPANPPPAKTSTKTP